MKKLIVHSNDAPIKNISTILATWATLADLVDQKVRLPQGCHLQWELSLQKVSPLGQFNRNLVRMEHDQKPEEQFEGWESYSSVRMVFPAYVGKVNDRQCVEVPMTEVSEVMIYENGTIYWHSYVKKPEDDPETIAKLAEAVSKGKLPSGHHYECNFIPRLKSIENK